LFYFYLLKKFRVSIHHVWGWLWTVLPTTFPYSSTKLQSIFDISKCFVKFFCSPWWNRTTILRIKIWCNQPLYQGGVYFTHDVNEHKKTLNFFGSGSHIKIITLYLLRNSIWTIQIYRPTIAKLRLHWLTNMVNWVSHCFICI